MTKEEDLKRVLEILHRGSALAGIGYGRRANHARAIWVLLEEAVATIDAGPDQERTWLKSGTRSQGWHSIGLTKGEARAVEVARIMSAMHPADGEIIRLPAIHRPDPERALEVMSWLRFLEKAKKPKPLQRAAVAVARGADPMILHQIYAPGRKPHRQTRAEIKTRTAGYVVRGLREAYGIVPGPGLTWVQDQSASADAGISLAREGEAIYAKSQASS